MKRGSTNDIKTSGRSDPLNVDLPVFGLRKNFGDPNAGKSTYPKAPTF